MRSTAKRLPDLRILLRHRVSNGCRPLTSNESGCGWEADRPKLWRGTIRRRGKQIFRRARSHSNRRPAAQVSIAFELDDHRLVTIDETLRHADRLFADVDAHAAFDHFLQQDCHLQFGKPGTDASVDTIAK